ncbi:P-loop containing nucleoside triphosphate hydrolase protein [Obelidium mucronatum]|nr:P-loop containing nucleoside triphosphate hydrolase protein [Obelidium mucronatum]
MDRSFRNLMLDRSNKNLAVGTGGGLSPGTPILTRRPSFESRLIIPSHNTGGRPSISISRRSSHLSQASSVTGGPAMSEARDIMQLPYIEDSMNLCEGTKIGLNPTDSAVKKSSIFLFESQRSLKMLSNFDLHQEDNHNTAEQNNQQQPQQKQHGRKFLGTEWDSRHLSDSFKFQENRNYDFKFNVSVVGAKGTGKRTMVIKECEVDDKNSFNEGRRNINWEMDVEFKDKTYIVNDKLVWIEYWVANTSENVLPQTARLLSSSAATIFVFDVNSRRSFLEVNKWVNEMNKHPHHSYPFKPIKVLLANCLDSRKIRAIHKEEGKLFAERNKMFYHECSSNDRKTFKQVYYSIARLIMDPIMDVIRAKEDDEFSESVPDVHVKAMLQGFVRSRVEIEHSSKIQYFQMLEEMERNDDITETVDWL